MSASDFEGMCNYGDRQFVPTQTRVYAKSVMRLQLR